MPLLIGNLGKKELTSIAISLAKDHLSGLVSNWTLNAINKFETKIIRKVAVRAGKIFIYFKWRYKWYY